MTGPQRAAGFYIKNEHRRQKSIACDMGHYKHFARPVGRLLLPIPEADKQEGAQADSLPAKVKDKEVGAVDQINHAGDEDQHQHIKAGGCPVLSHVRNGVDHDHGANAGGHQGKQLAQAVYVVS